MVLDNSVRIPRAPTYSGAVSPLQYDFGYGNFTLFVTPSQMFLLSYLYRLLWQSYNPIFSMVWAPPLSLATTHGIVFTFLSCRYWDVSVPCVSPHLHYLFMKWCQPMTVDGFPHSDINGSLPAYCSPLRFAVRCVLLRLFVPRHSPYALSYLT